MNTKEIKCSACGSNDIVEGIRVGKTAETGVIGLSYAAGLIIKGTEPFFADLCRSCGTVRLHVKEKDKKWMLAE